MFLPVLPSDAYTSQLRILASLPHVNYDPRALRGRDEYWAGLLPSPVQSIFDRISGLGLDGQIFGWAGRTGLLFEATMMDWIGLDLIF